MNTCIFWNYTMTRLGLLSIASISSIYLQAAFSVGDLLINSIGLFFFPSFFFVFGKPITVDPAPFGIPRLTIFGGMFICVRSTKNKIGLNFSKYNTFYILGQTFFVLWFTELFYQDKCQGSE